MAGLCICYKFFPINKDKFSKGTLKALTKGSNNFTLISNIAYTLILAFVLGLLSIYIDVDLQKVIKLVLEFFIQRYKYGQANLALHNRLFKAKKPNLYYENLYMECWYFC